MQYEIEVKFLGVDHDDVRRRLKQRGAHLDQPMRLMRRTVFDLPANDERKDAHLRVRDEGYRVTMTYKCYDDDLSVDGTQEIETTVGDFDTTVMLLQAAGMQPKSTQESKREAWTFGDCEVVLDEWPWLKPYIEIEGPSVSALKKAAKALGFDWQKAVTGSTTAAYRSEYDIPREVDMGANPLIAFDMPVPDWMQKIRRTDV